MNNEQWKKKLSRAQSVEREILKYYRINFDKDACFPENFTKEYDILSKKVGNIEVKEDRMAHQTGNYAIEYEDAQGEPSGIAATKAEHFVLVDWDYVCFVATGNLKAIIEGMDYKKTVYMGYRTEEGRKAKGWLIPRDKILNNPLVILKERWFPVNV
jgi:hypothetical protein